MTIFACVQVYTHCLSEVQLRLDPSIPHYIHSRTDNPDWTVDYIVKQNGCHSPNCFNKLTHVQINGLWGLRLGLKSRNNPWCIYIYIYNDPKHTAKYASNYVTVHGINWFRTPAESPDLNPIEIVWHELKEFLRNIRKLCNKEQLIARILRSRQT